MTYLISDFLITVMPKMNYSLVNPDKTILKNENMIRTIGYGGEGTIAGGRERVSLYKGRFREVQEVIEGRSILSNDVDWEFKEKSFLIPSDFSNNELLSLGLKEKHIANAMVFLSLLRISTKYKEVVLRDVNPFSRINSIVLSEFMLTLGSGTKDMLKKLSIAQWIEIDHSYQAGIKSKGYRLGKRFENSKWISANWKESLEKFVPGVLQGGYISRSRDVLYGLWDRACIYFTNWQAMADGPLKEICKRTSEIGRKLIVRYCEALTKEINTNAVEHIKCPANQASVENGWTLEKQIQNYWDSLSYFDGKSFSVTCHDERFKFFTYRLYSNVVNLKSEFRQFLELDGQQMVNVDIQSCQVALLATFYNTEDLVEKEKFIKIICEKDIYLFIAGDKIERKQAKSDFFYIMFDKNCNQKGETCRRFKEEFPILTQRIYDEKKRNGYKSVARLMQTKEASIMILGALNKLLFVNEIEAFSIHDSIFCLLKDVKLVEETIRSFFTNQMGFCPAIKVEAPRVDESANRIGQQS